MDPCGDGGFAWSLAYRLSQGDALYRDIFLPYTPGIIHLLALGVRLFGPTAGFFLFANWIPAIAAGILLLRAGRPFLSTLERLALAGVLIATSILAPGTGRLVWPYSHGIVPALALSVGALLAVRGAAESLGRRALFAGALAGLAFACKQEVGVAVALALGIAALCGLPRPIAWLTRVGAGFAAVLLPLAVYVFSAAPLASLRQDSHLWPLAAPPPSTKYLMLGVTGLSKPNLPRAAAATALRDLSLLAALAALVLLLTRERNRSAWLRLAALAGVLLVWWLVEGRVPGRPLPSLSLSMFVAVLVTTLAFFTRDLPDRAFLVSFSLFAALTGARTAFSSNLAGQYGGPGHFATALTSVVFLVIFVPRLLLTKTPAASSMRTVLTLSILALSWWQTLKAADVLRYPENITVATRAGRVVTAKANADLLTAVSRHSSPGERVLALPGPYAIDAVFGLRAVTPLIDVIPGWFHADMERRLIERLEKSPPDVVVVWQRRFKEFHAEPFGVGYGVALSDWISRHYMVAEAFPTGEVLRRR